MNVRILIDGIVRQTITAIVLPMTVVLGCATQGSGASGETHFVKCKVDPDCSRLGPAYSCIGTECRPGAGAPRGSGGSPGNSTGGATLSAGGAGSLVFVDGGAGGALGALDAGTCGFAHDVCGGLDSYVDIQGDASPLRLSYPKDPSCGTCVGNTCELWSLAHESCGSVGVILAACAGPNGTPPCLDTSPPPSYIDPSGNKWTQVALGGSSDQPGANVAEASIPVLDLDLTLTISDGVSTHELPVHAHTCGNIFSTLAPCH